jgi:hypothetical protein
MNILDALRAAQGGGAVQNLGQQFGLDEAQVSSALSVLVPALAAGFQKNMSSPQGLDGLMSALSGGQHRQYVDNGATLGRPETVQDGNGILGHVFGSKDLSRQVASRAAAQTGIGESILKGMLPVVAAMMMGAQSAAHRRIRMSTAASWGNTFSAAQAQCWWARTGAVRPGPIRRAPRAAWCR